MSDIHFTAIAVIETRYVVRLFRYIVSSQCNETYDSGNFSMLYENLKGLTATPEKLEESLA